MTSSRDPNEGSDNNGAFPFGSGVGVGIAFGAGLGLNPRHSGVLPHPERGLDRDRYYVRSRPWNRDRGGIQGESAVAPHTRNG